LFCLEPCGGDIEPVAEATSATTYLITYTPEEPGKIVETVITFKKTFG